MSPTEIFELHPDGSSGVTNASSSKAATAKRHRFDERASVKEAERGVLDYTTLAIFWEASDDSKGRSSIDNGPFDCAIMAVNMPLRNLARDILRLLQLALICFCWTDLSGQGRLT